MAKDLAVQKELGRSFKKFKIKKDMKGGKESVKEQKRNMLHFNVVFKRAELTHYTLY